MVAYHRRDDDELNQQPPPQRAAPPPPNDDALTLPLDADELRMLDVFHKSFNLPGLRHGLVRPVLDVDYYPPDDDFEDDDEQQQPEPLLTQQRHSPVAAAAGGSDGRRRRPARPAYEEPDASQELAALLQQTRAMRVGVERALNGEDTAEDGIAEEIETASHLTATTEAAHQRQVLRRPGSASMKPSSRPGSSSAKPSSASGRVRGRW